MPEQLYDKESTMPRENIHFNPERAVQVAKAVQEAYTNGRGLFRHAKIEVSPEHRAVEGITSKYDKSCLLFCAIATDRGVQSRIHYPKFRAGYDINPRNILPNEIASSSSRQVKELFGNLYGIGLTQVVREIHESCKIIAGQYEGDPRKIFEGIPCVHDAVVALSDRKSHKKLPGFGAQVTKLLLKNYTELCLVEFPNAQEAQPKIDLHQIRISIGTGILTFEKEGRYHASAITQVLSEGYETLCRERRLDGRTFNSLLWTVGSNLCNRRDEEVCFGGCPLYGAFCTKLPHANYRATGKRNDGTVDTRIDVRELREPLFKLEDLAGLEKTRKDMKPETAMASMRKRSENITLDERTNQQMSLFSTES